MATKSNKLLDNLENITDDLLADLRPLRFKAPVTHVYNPLVYARPGYRLYLQRYAAHTREIVLLGMNPGPWGMSQTGIPFGEVAAVRNWLNIQAPVGTPDRSHPKRPVTGFDCTRSEVSGRRLWGWAQKTFQTPARFFSRFFVANYCPLQFIEAGGRNRTPNQLPAGERRLLFSACDRALRRTVAQLQPHYVIGVGKFAGQRAREALDGFSGTIGSITHPSPANPRANRGWEALVEKELDDLGIRL